MSVPDAVSAAFVARLAGLVRQGGTVLDASGDPGPHRPALRAAGLQVTARPLRDLAASPDRFDGLLCVGALDHLTSENWPAAAARLAVVLRDQAPAYVAIERPRDQVARWLAAAGFAVTDQADTGRRLHLLLARTTAR